MSDPLTEAFKALGPWPIVQFVAACLIVYGVLKAMNKGEKDRKTNGSSANSQPSWSLYGPVHDAMGAIHEMNEQSRNANDLLERIETCLQACKTTLELIRNESRLR